LQQIPHVFFYAELRLGNENACNAWNCVEASSLHFAVEKPCGVRRISAVAVSDL